MPRCQFFQHVQSVYKKKIYEHNLRSQITHNCTYLQTLNGLYSHNWLADNSVQIG